jgi:thiamine biosynthesis lipoprotein
VLTKGGFATLPPVAKAVLRVFLAAALAGAIGCWRADSATEIELAGSALGTAWSVNLVTREALRQERIDALRSRVETTLERVDRGMSTWREDSELVRFNRQAGLAPFALSPETRRVIAAALELARETRGAFDPTVAPLVRLWGFGAEAASVEAGADELARARQRVGWRHLAWSEEGRLLRRVAGVQLDLSAIAKGYAVDAIAAELARDGPVGLLVELGGEVRALGTKSGGVPWQVGIDHPDAAGSRLAAVVTLTGGGMATSGDYRQLKVVEGRRRIHVVDPRSGRPIETGVASASVLAPSCMEADAVATALMVLGVEEGIAWVEKRPWLEALLAVRRGERVSAWRMSSGWPDASVPAPTGIDTRSR